MRRLAVTFVVASACWLASSWLALGLAEVQPEAAATVERAPTQRAVEDAVGELNEPLYTPFIERYVLDELKQLRIDVAAQRAEFIQSLVDRDLSIGDKAMNYATNTVTYFFYLIAAVSSILVIVGWTSIRDIRDKVHSVADKEVQQLVKIYEERLHAIEKQLTQKTRHIDQNREAIERTQELHALWLRAQQEHAPANKILFYDEILKMRPTDCEALTYKADAILELREPNWAKELCAQALRIDPDYGYAHYQMACACVALGELEQAMVSLHRAVSISESFVDEAAADPALAPLHDLPEFAQQITARAAPHNVVKS